MCKLYIPGAFLTALSWLAIHHLPGMVTHSSTALLLCRMWMRLMNVNEANSVVLARPPATLNLTWRYFIANVNCDLSQRRAEWMCFLCEGYSRCQMVVVMSFAIPNMPRVWLCTLAYYAACISMIKQEIVWSPVLYNLSKRENMLTGCSDAHQVIAVHLDQALLCPCLKFNQLQIRQAASGWVSVRAFILSSGIPCISVLDTTCVKIKIALSPLEAQNSEHICPALRDMHLIYLSVTLVYISGEKKQIK